MEALLNHSNVPRGQFCQEASWDDIEVDSLLQAVMPAKNRALNCKKGSGDMQLHIEFLKDLNFKQNNLFQRK